MVIDVLKNKTPNSADLNYSFPDQYVSEAEKLKPDFIKNTLDYFKTIALAQYSKNKVYIDNNFNILSGKLTKKDYYEAAKTSNIPGLTSFMDSIEEEELPQDIVHYPIVNPPINSLIGELVKRPDDHHIKAVDDDSKSEEMQRRSQILQDFLMEEVRRNIFLKMAKEQGISEEDINNDPELQKQLQQKTGEQLNEEITKYNSATELWANMTLEACKIQFKFQELSAEAMKYLLLSAKEYYEIVEDNSDTGFRVITRNPKEVWKLKDPNKKYIKDAYACGTVEVMEFSQILNDFQLDMDEIDELRKSINKDGISPPDVRESNLFNNSVGLNSVTYDTYSPLQQDEQLLLASQLQENRDALDIALGIKAVPDSFGGKFIVVKSYFISKKKIGKLTYMDPETKRPEVTIVDETYKKIPEEIEIEWSYTNQLMKGVSIGPNVYKLDPFTRLDYAPIIGVDHDNAIFDLMKPFQILYNVNLNQAFSLLKMEIGNIGVIPARRIPRVKDGDDGDALELFELTAKERGFVLDDDSPENTKSPVSNQNILRAVDLSKAQEIQTRYNFAVQLKNECWELIGFNRQRLGSVLATETATGTNTALSQSYAQTEPIFAQHDYVLDDLCQAIIDYAKSIEQEKPMSSVSYVNAQGVNLALQIPGSELSFAKLKVFSTSRAEDKRALESLRQLSGTMLQNGGSLYDVSVLYTTNSIRLIKDTFKKLKDYQEQVQQQEQQRKQQELEQQQKQFEFMQKEAERVRLQTQANDNYQAELDRINKKEVSIIATFKGQQNNLKDENANNVPDILETSRLNLDRANSDKTYQLALAKQQQESIKSEREFNLEMEKIQEARQKAKQDRDLEYKKLENNLEIAKYRDKGTKNSPKTKK